MISAFFHTRLKPAGWSGRGRAPAGAAQQEPVQWVRLDPHGESLAAAAVLQPEAMWAAQLERSRDAVAQARSRSQRPTAAPASPRPAGVWAARRSLPVARPAPACAILAPAWGPVAFALSRRLRRRAGPPAVP